MSVDALVFTADKRAAAVEFARIVRPGGRVVLTTWDYHHQPQSQPQQVPDHRPLFAEAGFDILSYDETEHWRERQTRTRELQLAAADELAAELGTDPAEIRTRLLELEHRFPYVTRRVLLVAQRSA